MLRYVGGGGGGDCSAIGRSIRRIINLEIDVGEKLKWVQMNVKGIGGATDASTREQVML